MLRGSRSQCPSPPVGEGGAKRRMRGECAIASTLAATPLTQPGALEKTKRPRSLSHKGRGAKSARSLMTIAAPRIPVDWRGVRLISLDKSMAGASIIVALCNSTTAREIWEGVR